jgi:D-amino-acid dehydrogenase
VKAALKKGLTALSTVPSVASTSVVIVGGGLIGLSSALALHERGAEVTVVDAAALGSGAARGNAGFLCPTLLAPLPGPGMLRNAARALVDRDGSLRIRPGAVPSMARWAVGFVRGCTTRQFEAGRAALAALIGGQPELLARLVASGVDVSTGGEIVVPFHDARLAERFHAELEQMGALGVPRPGALLDGGDLRRLVPALTHHVNAGFVLPGNRAADPRRFVDSLVAVLRSRAVQLLEHRTITGFDVVGDRIRRVRMAEGDVDVAELVLAAGAGLRALGRLLGLRLEVVAGQGYNVALPTSTLLEQPVIAEEVHAVATPFDDRIRLGGTMELTGGPPSFDPRRVDAIVRSMRRYLDLDWEGRWDVWSGSRPMSANGLPLLGRTRRFANVVVAGGHGMYGFTLAPATAAVVADLVADGRTALDLAPFDPDR